MGIRQDFALIKSENAYSNRIRASLYFEMFKRPQFIFDAKIDTGCSASLISASNLEFGISINEAHEMLLLHRDVDVTIGNGIEGRQFDKSELIECLKHLDNLKQYCRTNNLTLSETKHYVVNKCSNKEINTILGSQFARYKVPIHNVMIDGVETKTYGLVIGFNISNDVNLIGMSIIQNLYMETFSAYGNFYTLLTTLEKSQIDRVIEIGRQLRKKPTTVPY